MPVQCCSDSVAQWRADDLGELVHCASSHWLNIINDSQINVTCKNICMLHVSSTCCYNMSLRDEVFNDTSLNSPLIISHYVLSVKMSNVAWNTRDHRTYQITRFAKYFCPYRIRCLHATMLRQFARFHNAHHQQPGTSEWCSHIILSMVSYWSTIESLLHKLSFCKHVIGRGAFYDSDILVIQTASWTCKSENFYKYCRYKETGDTLSVAYCPCSTACLPPKYVKMTD